MLYTNNPRTFRLVSVLSLLIIVIGLFWLGTEPEWFALFPIKPPADKLVHFIVFGFIAALLWLSAPEPQPWSIFIITALIGAADELHQLYIPGRTTSFADFAADLIGIVATISILRYIQHKVSIPI